MKTMTDYALEARERAYAPYSGFSVGAALQGTDGRMFLGCNVENASYSMTICAERNAVLQAIAAGQRSFRSIAIVGGKTAEEARETPCVPCGACLQVLAGLEPVRYFSCYLADLEVISEDSALESASDSCGRVSCPN